MTATPDCQILRQPTVRRLGLEDGWWFFCPHFLNLGLPLVFVDNCLLPNAEQLGLEPFGARRPDTPLPLIDLRVRVLGDGVSLYGADHDPLTGHWFRGLKLPQTHRGTRVGLLVGDSYAVQLTWSALWTCRIGAAALVQAELEQAD